MGPIICAACSRGLRATNVFFIRIALLACMGVMAMPALAASERAVRARVMPMYPEIAKRMHIFGLVKIEATVDADGKVTAVKTLDGNKLLSVSAEEAVKKMKFASGTAETTEVVEIDFPRVN